MPHANFPSFLYERSLLILLHHCANKKNEWTYNFGHNFLPDHRSAPVAALLLGRTNHSLGGTQAATESSCVFDEFSFTCFTIYIYIRVVFLLVLVGCLYGNAWNCPNCVCVCCFRGLWTSALATFSETQVRAPFSPSELACAPYRFSPARTWTLPVCFLTFLGNFHIRFYWSAASLALVQVRHLLQYQS